MQKPSVRKYQKILEKNQRRVDGFFYTVPSSSVYPHQWLWDSCFHSIIYTRLKKHELAKDELRSLFAAQWPNGMLPHMIYWTGEKSEQDPDWGTDRNTSSITQPPMIAYSAEQIYKETNDKEFLKEIFPSLHKYYVWLEKDLSEDNLLYINHPWSSGEDDLPSWDTLYHENHPTQAILKKHKLHILNTYIKSNLKSPKFRKKNIFNVYCILFNSVYYRNLKSMLLFSKLVKNKKAEDYYKKLIPKVRQSYKKYLWNKKLKTYGSYSSNINLAEQVLDSSTFLSLFSEIPTQKEAENIVQNYLLNKEKFWTNYPIPTLSADEENFQPNRYWRGSVWININWFIVKGLQNYGLNDVADKLISKT